VDEIEYELYMEKFLITMWRDGTVYRTESQGCGWIPERVYIDNKPSKTNVMYIAATDEYARTHMTTRRRSFEAVRGSDHRSGREA
jgi:hypothetical protein